MSAVRQERPLLDGRLALSAVRSALAKLDPRVLARNPVMFVTAVLALLTTGLFVRDLAAGSSPPTARWSTAWRRSTNRRSPANRRQ